MDPLTHYLSAKLTIHIFLKEKTDRAISIFVLAAVFPDIDYITRIFGRAVYLKYHRGITHSFVGIVIFSMILAYLFSLKDKKSFKRMFSLSFISMLIHIMFDWTNSYGTQLFLPFSDKRAALDAVFIIDVYIWVAFIVSLIIIALTKKHKFAISVVASSVVLIYILMKIFINFEVVQKLERIPNTVSVAAFPNRLHPYKFKCVIEQDDKYTACDCRLEQKKGKDFLVLSDPTEYEKMPENEYTRLVKNSYLGEVFLDFARYPHFIIEPKGGQTIVKISDLRYRYSKKGGGFTAKFIVSEDMRIIKEGFRF